MNLVACSARHGPAVCSLLLATVPLLGAADALRDRPLIHDAGQPRVFEIATDELELTGPRARGVRFAPLASAEAVRQQASRLAERGEGEARLVLYEAGVPRNEFTRRVLTRQVVAQIAAEADLLAIAAAAGAAPPPAVPELPGWFRFEATGVDGALGLAAKLRRQPGVRYAEALLSRHRQKKLLPNDTFFSQQWHLLNFGQNGGAPGIDINVTNVWDTGRGAGIRIGIVDDGLQVAHPDLVANVSTALSWDFNFNDPDPSPDGADDDHGTAVAGVAAARGDNGVGVTGVAFEATLVGLRLLSSAPGAVDTDVEDAAAMLHSNAVIHIKNNSWGATDGPGWLEGPGPLLAAALAQGTATGRGGRGTIYVFAGGNGRTSGEDVNYDGYANSTNVFAVAALSDRGAQADYSEPGACLAVTAPSSSGSGLTLCSGGRQAITTTDLTGADGRNYAGAACELPAAPDYNYTQNFGGTSAATPIVSGVIALVLQANPGLSFRDVKEILLRSARKVGAGDADWSTNAAGIAHNHKFGAGLVNAGAAVRLATNWLNLGPLTGIALSQDNLNIPVPDYDPVGITRTFVVTNAGFRVEHVALTVTLPHGHYGDLAITLTSPSGVQSRLAEPHNSTGAGYLGWTLTSVRHWGEPAQGAWTVHIADRVLFNTGTLQALTLELYGSTPQAALAATRTNVAALLTLRAAAVGWKYELEASTDLGTWTPLTTLQIGPDGRTTCVETNLAGEGKFYRARFVP